MKHAFLCLLILLCSTLTFAQATDTSIVKPVIAKDTIWKKGAQVSLSFTQLSLTNWVGGGESSLGGSGYLNMFANLKTGNRIWDNTLILAYGLLKVDGLSTRKTDDKIDFLSKYGYNISKNMYASANINFNTQFTDGYKYPNDSVVVSKFMAPAYLQLGVGLDYKPVEYFSLSILPFTGRLTFVNDQELADKGSYGVKPATYDPDGVKLEPGETTKREFGGAIMALYKREIFTNISFNSKLQLFTNYLSNPQNIDVNWDSLLALKVNKYISTYIGIHVIYDDDITIVDKNGDSGPRTQLKQSFGVGLAMNF
jgi:hypothetical protein